ncbi:MAG: phosphoenolpyruvate--protein phosphotransferase [Phycisphaeraceae bacterium]
MVIKKGIAVSPGVVITRAVVLDAQDQPIPRRTVPASAVAHEQHRLTEAMNAGAKAIEIIRDQATASLGSETAKIFGFHLGMLRDKSLIDQIRQMIDNDQVTAEYAVYTVMRRLGKMFRQQESRMLRERVADIWDIERRVLSHLIGEARAELGSLRHEAAVVAHDLTPSQTAGLDKTKVKALVTDAGGRTSHTAIVAHALGIPAIVGLEDLSGEVNTGDTIIVDANNGVVIVNPDAAQLLEYRQHAARMAEFETSLDEMAQLPAVTQDGTQVTILANIEFPNEITAALAKGAHGIGLYRTEFLFLASTSEPSEDEQYAQYKSALESLKGQPLTIRTLDLGADKLADIDHDHSSPQENNPFLGCRSIRLCLQNLPLFKTQLRAILRASTIGPMRIMFPLISNIMELRQAKMVLSDVMEDLEEEGIPFRRDIPVGIMIEVPSAALQAKCFSREVQFFSIGTNDLIQYTVAVDRGNERIANLYAGAHPAVLILLRDVIRVANRAKIEVSLCGEMAGDPDYIMLLLGLGLRCFSVTPPAIPEVKRIVRAVSINQCQRVARKAMSFDSDREVLNYLHDQLQRVVPDIFQGRYLEP